MSLPFLLFLLHLRKHRGDLRRLVRLLQQPLFGTRIGLSPQSWRTNTDKERTDARARTDLLRF